MTSEEKARLAQLQFEMRNSSQQSLYPGDIWPMNVFDTHANGAYANANDLGTNLDPFHKNAEISQLQDKQHQDLMRDPERFNRIRQLLSNK